MFKDVLQIKYALVFNSYLTKAISCVLCNIKLKSFKWTNKEKLQTK